jgi:hypothetical protein
LVAEIASVSSSSDALDGAADIAAVEDVGGIRQRHDDKSPIMSR